jgi:hypothetical protein
MNSIDATRNVKAVESKDGQKIAVLVLKPIIFSVPSVGEASQSILEFARVVLSRFYSGFRIVP